MNPGLRSLIAPLSPESLFANGIPSEPFVVHNVELPEIYNLPFLASLKSLLEIWPGVLQAHLPDVRDESSSIDTNPNDARKLFANGMALLFNNAEKLSPILSTWLQALGRDIGLPNSTTARCMIYATPDGKGTAAHFDQNINFVYQIRGTKRWRLAANSAVLNPTVRFTMGQPIDPELASYLGGELPEELPTEQTTIELKPNSLLFVPRGYWHSTSAEGEALALNFTFSQPTWADLFLMALRSRLNLSSEWRELADGIGFADPEKRRYAEGRLDQLLVEIAADIPFWRAEDILNATEGPIEK